MSATPPESLPSLVAAARLRRLDVVQASYERSPAEGDDDEERAADGELLVEVRVAVRRKDRYPPGALSYLCEVEAKWSDAETARPVASASVTLLAAYGLEGIERALAEVEIVAFGEGVALHQAWPFLRERLRTFSVDLGLQPLLLPLKPLRTSPEHAEVPGGS